MGLYNDDMITSNLKGESIHYDRVTTLRVAIVHDWLNQVGGAENVLEELVKMFPHADVYTSIFAAESMPSNYREWSIRTSFMQKLPGVHDHHQHYMPIYPFAFGRMDLSNYDLIISNKSGFCHGVQTHSSVFNGQTLSSAIHICYCLTPTRFLWSLDQYLSRERINSSANFLIKPLLPALRHWDRTAAQRVDHFIAISHEIKERIQRIYGRNSTIIHPPVDTDYFSPSQDVTQLRALDLGDIRAGQYYLIVSRLVPYKRIDLAVKAFAELPGESLVVVGEGRDRQSLESMSGNNVAFLGRLHRDQTRELLRHCKAFIFPGLEDFGIAPVEAMSVGKPVIAFAGGGALDTVLPGTTGEHFYHQTVESLREVLERFDPAAYSGQLCRTQAEKFSHETFRSKLSTFVSEAIEGRCR